MKIVILAVGRVKERPTRQICDDYLSRLARYTGCEEVELVDGPSDKLAASFQRLLGQKRIDTLVALDVGGEMLASVEFAKRLERWTSQGKGVVGFAIGGADGLPAAVRAAAQFRLSFSPMTLPHRLARIVLCEQLYRAYTILRNEPYNH